MALFPRHCRLFQLAAIIPIGTSSVERAFSKMKLILIRLRAHMGEELLDDIFMVSSELPWTDEQGIPVPFLREIVNEWVKQLVPRQDVEASRGDAQSVRRF